MRAANSDTDYTLDAARADLGDPAPARAGTFAPVYKWECAVRDVDQKSAQMIQASPADDFFGPATEAAPTKDAEGRTRPQGGERVSAY